MSALCPQDLEEVRTKLRRGNQILFTRDSGCLQPLLSLIRRQSHRTLVLWALEGCRPPLALLARRWPGEQRPVQAVQAARLWAQGRIKMPAARRAILAAHAAAKDIALDKAAKNLPIPLHPGAERFYKEKGVLPE